MSQSIEQLELENAALKADLKLIKDTVITITDGLKISKAGVFPEKVEVGEIIVCVMLELKKMMPSIIPFREKKKTLLDDLDLNKLVPIIEKYKNL